MGRKRARKRERRAAQRSGYSWDTSVRLDERAFDLMGDDEILAMLPMLAREDPVAPVTRACGGCREFLEDREGGRGTCLHPASGVLAPWTDTQACTYWARR